MEKFVVKRPAPQGFDAAEIYGETTSTTRVCGFRLPVLDINIDELPYDPADRKRIPHYSRNPHKQDDIRRIYLTRGPYRQQPGFKYPQKYRKR
jgi:hypothetical protein